MELILLKNLHCGSKFPGCLYYCSLRMLIMYNVNFLSNLKNFSVPSGPPLNIRTSSRSTASLTFTWDPPAEKKRHGVIIKYGTCLSYTKNGACFENVNQMRRSWPVSALSPMTKYFLNVSAETNAGKGVSSESLGFYTNGGIVKLKECVFTPRCTSRFCLCLYLFYFLSLQNTECNERHVIFMRIYLAKVNPPAIGLARSGKEAFLNPKLSKLLNNVYIKVRNCCLLLVKKVCHDSNIS